MNLKTLILDLFFNQKIQLSQLLKDDFDLAFNVSGCSTTEQRKQIIFELLDNQLLTCENDGYLALTQKGGAYWESVFKPNWALYHELFSIDNQNGDVFTYFYACDFQVMNFFYYQWATFIKRY